MLDSYSAYSRSVYWEAVGWKQEFKYLPSPKETQPETQFWGKSEVFFTWRDGTLSF